MDRDLFQQYNNLVTNIITKNATGNQDVIVDLIARKTAESLKNVGISPEKYQHYERLRSSGQK